MANYAKQDIKMNNSESLDGIHTWTKLHGAIQWKILLSKFTCSAKFITEPVKGNKYSTAFWFVPLFCQV